MATEKKSVNAKADDSMRVVMSRVSNNAGNKEIEPFRLEVGKHKVTPTKIIKMEVNDIPAEVIASWEFLEGKNNDKFVLNTKEHGIFKLEATENAVEFFADFIVPDGKGAFTIPDGCTVTDRQITVKVFHKLDEKDNPIIKQGRNGKSYKAKGWSYKYKTEKV